MKTHPGIVPQFSSFLFWDSDLEKIDYRRDRNKVIRRVFDLGLVEDVVEVLWYYNREELVGALTSATYLPQNVILFASSLFHLKPEDFKWVVLHGFNPIGLLGEIKNP